MDPEFRVVHVARAAFRAVAQLLLLIALAAPLASPLPSDALAQPVPCPPMCGGGGGPIIGAISLDYQGSAASTFNGQVGVAVSLAPNVSGGTAPYTYTSSALPAGLTIDPATGVISGTPTAADPGGATLGAVTVTVLETGGPLTDSATITFDIAKATPNVVVIPSATTVTQGTSITFNVNVLVPGVNATGAVTFVDAGSNLLAGPGLNGAGQTSFSTASLPVGTQTLTVNYTGDANYNAGSTTVTVTVNAAPPAPAPAPTTPTPTTPTPATPTATVTLSSSANPVGFGAPLTVSATVAGSGVTPTGTVEFEIACQAQKYKRTLSDGAAQFSAQWAFDGTRVITARYSGDANYPATTATFTQQVTMPAAAAAGQSSEVTIQVENKSSYTAGVTLSSSEPWLNAGMITHQVVSATLAAGDYAVSIALVGAGTGTGSTIDGARLTGVVCSSGGTWDQGSGRLSLKVTAGVNIKCTVRIADVAAQTSDLQSSASQTLTTTATIQTTDIVSDRIGSGLSDGGVSPNSTISGFLAMLPGAAAGGPVTVGGSLAALEAAMGNTGKRSRLDIWFQARWQGVRAAGVEGNLLMGVAGIDYLITPKLLLGGFLTVDNGAVRQLAGPGTVSGTGWLVGAYMGGKLSEHLILEGMVGGGTAWNRISPFGTYTDGYTTTRLMASTSLTGSWKRGNWTFVPRVRLSYGTETSAAYTDTLGVAIPSTTAGLFEGAIGPGFSDRFVTGSGMVVEPGLSIEAVARVQTGGAGATAIHGRATPKLSLRFTGGTSVNLSTNVQLGANYLSYGASADVRIPLR